MVAWIAAFVAEADRRTGQLPVIYTHADWWDSCTGDSAAFAADPLWVASFGEHSDGARGLERHLDLLAVHRRRPAAGHAGCSDRRELAEQHRTRARRGRQSERPDAAVGSAAS